MSTRISSLSLIGAVLAGLTAVTAAHAEPAARNVATVKPLTGLMLDAGTKHAVGYFEVADGGCNLTLLVADAATDDVPMVASRPARFSTLIGNGRTARIDTVDGPSLEFACATNAASLDARVVQRLAYVPLAK